MAYKSRELIVLYMGVPVQMPINKYYKNAKQGRQVELQRSCVTTKTLSEHSS